MSLIDDYLARTPRSRELFERATGSLPGGSTRTTVYTAPYPPYIASGSGLRIRDVDGNVYRDFLGNYTSLILGSRASGGRRRGRGAGPPRVGVRGADRDRDRARRGDPPARPVDRAAALHELRHRGDDVRDPGRPGIHRAAAHRQVRALVPRHPRRRDDRDAPASPRSCRGLVVELPWGDPDGVEAALRGRERRPRRDHHRAGPGCRRRPGARTRASCRSCARSPSAHGALLIFDEIISFRVAPGGAQERFGVRPGPDDARQDHRRRLSARGVRRSRGRHGDLRRAAARCGRATAARSTATRSPRRPASRRSAS